MTRNAAASARGIFPGDTVVVQGTKDKDGDLVATQITATSKTAAAAGGGVGGGVRAAVGGGGRGPGGRAARRRSGRLSSGPRARWRRGCRGRVVTARRIVARRQRREA